MPIVPPNSPRCRLGVCLGGSAVGRALLAALLSLAGAACAAGAEPPGPVSLADARVVVPEGLAGPAQKAVDLLVDEIARRTQLRLPLASRWPEGAQAPVIVLATRHSPPGPDAPPVPAWPAGDAAPAEGYLLRLETGGAAPIVWAVGNDDRGLLFAVGRLLRGLAMARGRLELVERFDLATAPAYPIRGHQLGYRPKTNSYDAWDLPQWERYFRDLAVFGSNAVELIPPRSDDADDSPHFPRPKLEMMAGMSQLAADYGLDVWIWYPALDRDYDNPATVERALDEWRAVLASLPRVDAIFVPTGDPGHTPPAVLMAMLEKQSRQLRELHAGAETWISVQSFTQAWFDEMLSLLAGQQPEWLAGVVYGPQTRVTLPELRRLLPERYPIRRYPDITHSLRCQYPVPDWDVAFAFTEAREVINPRPRDQAAIFRAYDRLTTGFITYSEGCNDDVNKIVWSALGWDPSADVVEVLRQYGRYFVGPDEADDVAQGLLALERNWRFPEVDLDVIQTTLAGWQALERRATPAQRANWRLQQPLYRAYYDAYQQSRRLYETDLQARAFDVLRAAPRGGSLAALARAEATLARAATEPVAAEHRARVYELAEALFQSIGMQLSVDRYQAIDVGRGANLDTIDVPLNDRNWLLARFDEIRRLAREDERLAAIDAIVHRTDPGPGGFYDDLGDPRRQPHLVGRRPYALDPGFLESPAVGFHYQPQWPAAWCTHVDGLYETPVSLHYPDLDPRARYRIRVVYAGDNSQAKVRLVTGEGLEIHPLQPKPQPVGPLEFDIPSTATRAGSLTLTWHGEAGRGGPGRGCQLAEAWLIKVPDPK